MPDQGARVRTLLATYERAGGRDARLLLHGPEGREAIARIARRGRGLPARVIPFEVHHAASTGLDLWMAALAWGACGVDVMLTGDEAPQYREALAFQMRLGNTIAEGSGYQGEHFRIVEASDPMAAERALWSAAACARRARRGDVRRDAREAHHAVDRARPPRAARAGAAQGDPAVRGLAVRPHRREPRDLHHVPRVRRRVPRGRDPRPSRGAAAAVHRVEVRAMRHLRADLPRERDQLEPQLDLTAEARAPRVLNEAEVVGCTSCGKPLGTRQMIDGCSRSSRSTRCSRSPARSIGCACARTAGEGDVRRRAGRNRPAQGRPHLNRAEIGYGRPECPKRPDKRIFR
jgi:hypothetical protein